VVVFTPIMCSVALYVVPFPVCLLGISACVGWICPSMPMRSMHAMRVVVMVFAVFFLFLGIFFPRIDVAIIRLITNISEEA